MRVEEVGISPAVASLGTPHGAVGRKQGEHVGYYLERMVAVEEPCPEVYLPAETPPCRHVSPLFEGDPSRIEEFGRRERADLGGRIQSVEMRYVPVLVIGIVGIVHPFLQLPVLSHFHRRQQSQGVAQGIAERGIDPEDLRGLDYAREGVMDYLVVHGAAGRYWRRLSERAVLGADRRNHNEISAVRLEVVEAELCGTLEHRIPLPEEVFVEGVQVVLPQVRRKPRASAGIHPPERAVDYTRYAPDIGIVVGDPAVAAVHLPCGHGSGLAQVAYHGEQRPEGLVQAGHLGRPVVHLGIDVYRILAVPGSEELVVPDALQVGGLSSCLRGAYQQIASVVEHQRHHRHVVASGKGRQPLVRRQGRALSVGELYGHPAVLLGIGLAVVGKKFVIRLRQRVLQPRRIDRGRVAVNRMVVDEVGGGADDYGGVAGSRHEEAVRLADEGSVSQHLHPAFRLERGRNPFLLDTFHLYQQAVAGGGGAELQRAVGTERES